MANATIDHIEQGGQKYSITIPNDLTDKQQAEICDNIGAVREESTVIKSGNYPDMTVGNAEKAAKDADGNNIATTYIKINDLDRFILEAEYPVGGKPYIQFPNTPTPAERWAGTAWEIDTEYAGRALIGSGGEYAFGATGGSADAVVVEHSHDIIAFYDSLSDSSAIQRGSFGSMDRGETVNAITQTGESGVGKNMPPYTVVNFWKRTA